MSVFYVYEHWRLDRDECFYVGKGKGKRAYVMVKRNRHHLAIQAKVSREGSAIEVRMVATGLTEEDAFNLEKERIRFWRAAGADLTNMTDGGDGVIGYIFTKDVREKMSISQKKRGPRNPHSIEARAKISKSNIGSKRRLGKTHSDKTKNVLSELGKKNIAKFKKFSCLGPKSVSKPVKCETDGKIFESASEAARHYGSSKSAIIELCLGKNFRKTVNNRVFKYVEAL
jgi:ribosomal protein S16